MKTAKNFNCFIYTTLALSVVLIASSVCQAGFQEGVAAYNHGNYKTALKEFRLVEQGDAMAQYNLGLMYDNGEGVPEDHTEAVKWYRKAAEQGLAKAQFNLGLMYDNGRGVPEDHTEAVKWYRKAAEQGLAEAQFNLGFVYANGEGVPEDDTEAVKWYRKAAEQGLAKAQFNLGLMYANGEGVPEDDTRAYAWLNLAAAQSNKNAIKRKELLRKRMTPTQIAEAQKLSRILFECIHGK